MQLINDLTNQISKLYSDKTLMVLEPRNLNNQDDYKNLLISMRDEYKDKQVVYSYNTFDEIMSKSTNVTTKQVFIKFLMTIKGVSLEKAIAIQSHYKVPRNLLMSFKKCQQRNPEECPSMIHHQLQDEVGVRKIGLALSAKIASVFLNSK